MVEEEPQKDSEPRMGEPQKDSEPRMEADTTVAEGKNSMAAALVVD
jgi:hypothetical protein